MYIRKYGDTAMRMEQTLKPRMMRGFAIVAQANQIKQAEVHTFKVRSQSGNGQYVVTNGFEWDCTCPDHVYREIVCKHIFAVKFWIALKEKIDSSDVFQLYQEFREASTCKFCDSVNIIKWGYRKNKTVKTPRFKCKDCGQSFVVDEGFAKMRFDPKIITLALDLYFKGVSLRKIGNHINQFYGLQISHMGVYKWLQKYGKIVNDYVNQLELELSEVWNTDEMKVKCGGKWVWLWNVMDSGTRFLLASQISGKREIMDARKVFQEAKKRGKTKPSTMITDGLPAYIKAFKKEFFTLRNPRTKHIRNVGFRDKTNNNRIERFHGTHRERDKVMRGLKRENSPIVDGFRVHYNFIRPHQSLKGKTPAEEAKIDLRLGKNKWLSLIKKSSNHTNR